MPQASRPDFDLIVDFLLKRGNRLRREEGKPEQRWRCDKEGDHVHLQNPIDFDASHEHFTFGSDVRVVSESDYQFIEGTSEWISIEWNRAASDRLASNT
ncbi:MAG TPA: hypothetical protein VF553_14465 [Pyrinomonadaceae bacterium]